MHTVRPVPAARVLALVLVLLGVLLGTTGATAAPSAAAAGATAFGMSVPSRPGESRADAVRRTQQRFGRLPLVRVYAGRPPTTWQADRTLSVLPAGTDVVYTFSVPSMASAAAGAYDAGVRTLLLSRPAGSTMWIGLQHEPEGHVARGEFTTAQFRAATSHVAQVVHSEGGRATTVLTGSTAFAKGGQGYRDYFSPDIDVLAWDAYNSGQKKPGVEYKDPSRFINPVKDIARQTGKGFGWGEFGAPCIVSDRGCQQRSRWLTATGRAMSDSGAQFVSYWNRVALNGSVDYSLWDTASANAWKALMQG